MKPRLLVNAMNCMKRVTTLLMITLILISFISGTSYINYSLKAYAQADIFQKSMPASATAADSTCKKLSIKGVTANGNDGHVPTNVLDNNLNTRWSKRGIGSSIQADLAGQNNLCSVDIAWYRGNLRHNDFAISVSTDGTSFTTVFSGKSSGTTLSAEKYNLSPNVLARYVRITVDGNTENNWASITELNVNGFSAIPINSPPTANNLNITTNTNTSVQINLTGTSPIQGDTPRFSVVTLPKHGSLVSTQGGSSSVTYNPTRSYSGPDSFTYKATDGQGVNSTIATVSITVNAQALPPPPPPPPAQQPTANSISTNTNRSTPVRITLTGTDPIPGDVLRFSVVTLPQHGTVSPTPGATSNTVTYTPNSGFSGQDSFTYRDTDVRGDNSTIATVSITVIGPVSIPPSSPPPPLPAPTVNNINVQTNKGAPVQITLSGTDPIPGDMLKFSLVAPPKSGVLTNGTVSSSKFYTPNPGFIGPDSFTYKATDSQGVVSSNIATVNILVSNSTYGTLDPFGIREIYPTKAGGEQWFMNVANPNHDSRTEPQTTLTKNSDGSWKITSNAVRFNVFTSSGYHHELITTLNQAHLAAKGYMQSPNDWKNIEMTGYVKFNKGDVSDGFTWYARGGHHTSSIPCEGTSIKEELDFAGTTRFEKEQWHVHYVFTPHKPATGPIQGKWVGFKAIMYNVIQKGLTALKEEIWLDSNDNGNWVKVNEFTDAGGFGDQGQVCGGKPDQIITWGGPIATFRWDKTTDVDIKDFSVREIQPPQ